MKKVCFESGVEQWAVDGKIGESMVEEEETDIERRKSEVELLVPKYTQNTVHSVTVFFRYSTTYVSLQINVFSFVRTNVYKRFTTVSIHSTVGHSRLRRKLNYSRQQAELCC